MAEIQLIPLPEIEVKQIAAIRNTCIEQVKRNVAAELRLSLNNLLVRDIQPKVDLGFTYETWAEITGASSGDYETLISGTMADKRFVALYGIVDRSPEINISKVKIKVGNSDKVVWQLETLYSLNGNDARVGIAPTVILIPQNRPFVISRYVLNTYAPAHIVFKGFVVEPYGKTMSP